MAILLVIQKDRAPRFSIEPFALDDHFRASVFLHAWHRLDAIGEFDLDHAHHWPYHPRDCVSGFIRQYKGDSAAAAAAAARYLVVVKS